MLAINETGNFAYVRPIDGKLLLTINQSFADPTNMVKLIVEI